MSGLTDLIITLGQTVGWSFILLIFFIYELFWPDFLHPKSTKLKQLFREPNEGVIAALEAVYVEHDKLSRERLIDELNGDVPRVWDFQQENFIKDDEN